MSRLTLDQFRLTRTPCVDFRHHDVLSNSYPVDDFEKPVAGFVYVDACHIEACLTNDDDGEIEGYMLTVCNDGWTRPRTPEGLAELEEILYNQWYLPEIADPEESADEPVFEPLLLTVLRGLAAAKVERPDGEYDCEGTPERAAYDAWLDTVRAVEEALKLPDGFGILKFYRLAGFDSKELDDISDSISAPEVP